MKEKQRALIIEIMKADEEAGLYTTRKQTAVDWYEKEINSLFEKYESNQISRSDFLIMKHNLFYSAKQMEKEQMNDAYKEGYFVTFPSDIDFNEYYKDIYESE